MPTHLALPSNRYPRPPEEAILREHLARTEEERRFVEQRRRQSQAAVDASRREVEATERALQAAREALEAAQFVHDGVTSTCRALDDRVTQVRSRLHPVRRVPDNILGEIFQYAVDACHVGNDAGPFLEVQSAPFRPAATCRSWRAAALARARLWQYLDLDMTAVSEHLRAAAGAAATDRDEPCQDCRWCRFIKAHLERSERIPIHLRLVGSEGLRAARLLHIWRLVATISPRLLSLEIQYGDLTGSGLDLLLRSAMPILETVAIDCTPSIISSRFFQSAPRLRECRMRHFVPHFSAEYPALVALDIICPVDYSYAPPLRLFHYILANRCPGLEKLTIDVARLRYDNSPKGMYPHVKDLSLTIREDDERQKLVETIDSFVFPCVQRLHLSLPEQPRCNMIRHCWSTLVSLILSGGTLSASCATPLTEAPLLESVELVDCSLTEGFFRGLSSLPDGSVACPVLHKLHIKDCRTSSPDGFTGTALLALIRLRNGADVRRISDVAMSWEHEDVALRPGFEADLQALLQ